jgi:CheY-like chemotaxis protein
MGQVTLLRQAVITAISYFNQQGPHQKIVITSERSGTQGQIRICGRRLEGESPNRALSSRVDIPAALVNLMGLLRGGVEIHRDVADETTIFLTFPAQRQFKILVVDDNADAIRLVEKYLASGIYTVAGVQDPEQVLAELEKEAPALILMDVMLPNVDGWMLLSQIRRKPALSKLPVIISTILPQEDLSISLGADGFLRKPYTQQELLSVLEAHLLKNPA